MSIGGRAEESQSRDWAQSESTGFDYSLSQSGSFVDPSQQPFLDVLRQSAMELFQQGQPQTAAVANQQMGQRNDIISNLIGLGDPSAAINAQLTGLKSGLNDLFTQGQNTIGDQAIGAGAFGGSRQAMADAALGGELADAFTRGFGDIMARGQDQAIGANTAALTGVGQNLKDYLGGQYGGIRELAGILGAPTVLSNQSSIGYGQNQSQSEAGSQSGSESAGFSFGFGDK